MELLMPCIGWCVDMSFYRGRLCGAGGPNGQIGVLVSAPEQKWTTKMDGLQVHVYFLNQGTLFWEFEGVWRWEFVMFCAYSLQ